VSESPVKARPVTGCDTEIKNIIGAPLAVQLCATPFKKNQVAHCCTGLARVLLTGL